MKDYELNCEQLFISNEQLKEVGFSQYKINNLVNDGFIEKINRKYYENLHYDGEDFDFYYVHPYIPSGVICLMSAATFYGLTTYIPDVVDAAVYRKTKVNELPEYPDVKLYYFSKERYGLGINEINENGNVFKIYDIEKTVVDIVSYREKIGIEEVKKVLRNYLKRNDRDINKLIRYSKIVKCDKVLRTYLEVLV